MKRIGIIAALAGELKPLVEGWEAQPLQNGFRYSTTTNGLQSIAVFCGMGREAAATACMQAMADGPLTMIVSIGWAGALSDTFRAGQSYRVTDVVDAATGERYLTDGDAAEKVKLVTARRVILKEEKPRLAEDFGAVLVDMEAATVARLARARDIPFYCYKAVSDAADDALPDMNPYIAPNGQMRTGAFAAHVIWKPQHWPALIRLGKNSSAGAVALANDVMKLQREIENANGSH